MIFLLILLLATVGPVWAENIDRSTENISPFGMYAGLQAAKTLTTGIQATSPGTPSNAAQSSVLINGDVQINKGNLNIDEIFDAGSAKTYISTLYDGAHWFGINIDPATVPLRAEFEVNGDIFAKYYRASPGQNFDADQLLYFGMADDGTWVEAGSKMGSVLGISDPQSVARFYASPKIVLNYYSQGNVGIGVVDPAYKLQVGELGSGLYAMAHSWESFSSRKYKKNISHFSKGDIQKIYAQIDKLNVVHFRYKNEKSDDQIRTGVIAEEAPKELLSADGTTLSMTDTIGFIVAGIQALKVENENLEKDITKLERAVNTLRKKKGAS